MATKFRLATVSLVLVFLAGCFTISPAAKQALRVQAAASQNRAEIFRAMAPRLTAKDAADARTVEEWKAAFQQALDADAEAMRNWVKAYAGE